MPYVAYMVFEFWLLPSFVASQTILLWRCPLLPTSPNMLCSSQAAHVQLHQHTRPGLASRPLLWQSLLPTKLLPCPGFSISGFTTYTSYKTYGVASGGFSHYFSYI